VNVPAKAARDLLSGPILVRCQQNVATVTLNVPERLNTFTPIILDSLRHHLGTLSDDPDIRVIVLTGAGRAFSAGGDIADMGARDAGDITYEFVRSIVRVTEVFYAVRPITIAAINGACAGGGMALACAADLRLAAESAVFVTAFLRIGTSGDMGLPWHLQRLVGAGKAKELSLLCDRIGAGQAVECGLVNRTATDEDLPQLVGTLAKRIAAFPPLAAAGLKRNLNDAAVSTFPQFLDLESQRFVEIAHTQDATEAVRAFAEHRDPNYRGS
jgi:2-(1,2-epoxy-1,2-dihydrophenyl)acetyl-CoA isomerase